MVCEGWDMALMGRPMADIDTVGVGDKGDRPTCSATRGEREKERLTDM